MAGNLRVKPGALGHRHQRFKVGHWSSVRRNLDFLKLFVGRRGRVEDALVVRSSGDERLDQAAEAAVRRWRYRPARRDGHPVEAVDYVQVEFAHEPAAPD